MGTRRNEEREARNTGVPQAWVWSQYRGESPPSEGAYGSAPEADPMLFEEKGLHPSATALGLAIAVAVVLGLVWLIAARPS